MLAEITVTSVVIWVVCLLLAVGVGWSRYEKRRTRDKFLRDIFNAAGDLYEVARFPHGFLARFDCLNFN